MATKMQRQGIRVNRFISTQKRQKGITKRSNIMNPSFVIKSKSNYFKP